MTGSALPETDICTPVSYTHLDVYKRQIQDGLRELEHRGVATIDCRRAQFSANEPIVRLRMICQSWKVMFHAEYSSGQPLRMLVDLRAAVDDALQNAAHKNPLARSAAASANSGGETNNLP